jgi:ankyrin repeat protein
MDPLSAAASAIAVIQLSASVLGTCYKYISQVKDAPTDVARIVSEVGSLKAILSDIQPKEALEGPLRICGEILNELDGKLKSSRFRWPFETGRVDKLLNKLGAQKSTFILVLAQANAETANDTLEAVHKLHSIVKTNEQLSRQKQIIAWLVSTDPTANHQLARSRHQPLTGQWFLKSAEFQYWFNNVGCLWVHAIPGAGKTIICSTAIEHVKKGAYYYFDFSDPKKRTVSSMLRSIIAQLSDPLPSCVEDLYKECNGREPSIAALVRALEGLPHTYIFIDALDECIEREEFFKIFKSLQKFSVFVTSRKEPDINRHLGVFPNVKLEDKSLNDDIRVHVRAALASHHRLSKWSDVIQSEIEEALTGQAAGMFRWAVCQLDMLRKCLRAANVRQALKTLPKTLDETYDRIFQNLEYPEEAKTALTVLTFAARPMTVREVAEAIAAEDLPDGRLPDPYDILEICSSFVMSTEINYGDLSTFQKMRVNYEGDSLLQFTHFSVKEYLQTRLNGNSLGRLYIDYLLSSTPDYAEYPLAIYAGRYWQKHWQGEDLSRLFGDKLLDVLNIFDPDLDHEEINAARSYRYRNEDDIPSALYYACLLGVPQLCNLPDSSRRGVLGFPLQAAAYSGNIECVQLLIANGADINEVGGRYGNALRCAAYHNHIDIVRLLLRHGIRDEGEKFGSALQAACVTNNTELVQLLDGNLSTALRVAVAYGSEDVVRQLLQRGAAIVDVDYALLKAVERGDLGCIQAIAENGGDMNNACSHDGTVLHIAAEKGHVGIVKYLLNSGSDPNAIGGVYCTPLQACLSQYNEEICELLLAAGADINIRGGRYRGCLEAALKGDLPIAYRLLDMGVTIYETALTSALGMPDIIPKLLELGADVDSCDSYGEPAIMLATYSPELFDLLLEHGANVNFEYKEKTVLLEALKNLPLEIVQKVITKANMTATGNETALAVAVRHCPEAVDMLLDAGVTINSKKDPALVVAVEEIPDNPEILSLIDRLLERGVNVNALSSNGKSALAIVCAEGNETVFQRLIQAGADINLGDPTPLEAALEFPSLVTKLLELGADPKRGDILAACVRENPDMISRFMNLGASPRCALNTAVKRKLLDVVKSLLSAGVKCDGELDIYGSSLQCAISNAKSWHDPILQELLKHDNDLDCPKGFYGSALECAIRGNMIEGVVDLLDRGANIDLISEKCTPLQAALIEGNKEIVHLLLDRGADINIRLETGSWHSNQYGSPLQIAVKKGYRDLVLLLLEKQASQKGDLVPLCAASEQIALLLLNAGANINAVDRVVGTALHAAARRADISLMKLLLNHGADLTIIVKGDYEYTGGTALHAAVSSGSLAAVKLLIEHGADLNTRGGEFCTALQFACHKLFRDIAKELIENGADINIVGGARGCALEAVCNTYDTQFVQRLIDQGAKVNIATTGLGGSPLAWAMHTRKLWTAETLLKNGADVNFQAGKFGTPLIAAARDTFTEGLRMMIARGANVNTVAGKYGTALQAAATRSAEHVQILLDAGAIQIDGGKYGSPLEAARRKNRPGAIKLLEKDLARRRKS